MAVRTTAEYTKLSRPETHFRKDCLADIRAIGYLATAIPDSRQLLGDKGEPDIRFTRPWARRLYRVQVPSEPKRRCRAEPCPDAMA